MKIGRLSVDILHNSMEFLERMGAKPRFGIDTETDWDGSFIISIDLYLYTVVIWIDPKT
jgi:hypothetical protein